LKPLLQRCHSRLSFRIVGTSHQHADPPHGLGLLRARSERPRRRRAAECSQQFPPSNGDCHTPLPCEVRKGISGLISRDLSSAAPLHFVSKP
jgi:hypothetical protein